MRTLNHDTSRVLARVKAGEEITITSAARPSPEYCRRR